MLSRPQAWLILSLTVFGAAYAIVLAKSTLARVDPLTFAWLQVAIGMGLVLLIPGGRKRGSETRTRRHRPPTRREWGLLVFLGVCNFTIARAAFLIALGTVTPTTQSYVVNFTAIVTMAMSAVILGERPARIPVVGAVVAVAGVHWFFDGAAGPTLSTGVAWLGFGVLALSITNTLGRILAIPDEDGRSVSARDISRLSLWIGGAPLVLAGIARESFAISSETPFAHVTTIGAADWAVVVLNATTSIAVGPLVFNYAFRVLRSYEASVIATSGLIYTAILSSLLLGEVLGGSQIAAILTMLVGIALTQVRR